MRLEDFHARAGKKNLIKSLMNLTLMKHIGKHLFSIYQKLMKPHSFVVPGDGGQLSS